MNVTKTVEKLENSAVKLTATVSKDDVAKGYKDGLKNLSKNIVLPGFRKGKVPANLIEQKYGEELKQEVLVNLIDESLNELYRDDANKDIRPLPYAQPRLENDKLPEFSMDKDFTYTVVYDVFPVVEVKNFDGIKVEEPQVKVGDKEIEEELKALQERNAAVIDKADTDPVEKDNIVTIDYKEIADDGSVVAGSEREGFVFTVGSGENIYKIDDEICGMKKNETKEITKKYDKKEEDAELAGKTKKISVTVKAVKVRNLPALDDDFAQDVSEKFKTLADLKADITKKLESSVEAKVKEVKSQSLLDQLVEKNPISLPASMVQAEKDSRWNMIAQQMGTTVDQLDKIALSGGQSKDDVLKQWVGDTEKMLKSRLIVDALIREKNISVTPEEVDAEMQKIADANGISLDEVKNHYNDPRAKEYLVDEVKEVKLFEDLYKQVKVSKGKETSVADLFNAK